jgi:sulfur carrier protein
MDVIINGKQETLPTAQITIADVLAARGLANRRVAIERNGEIVPRSLHPTTLICVGDSLEIVIAVGGG